jgi:hypothetical protein
VISDKAAHVFGIREKEMQKVTDATLRRIENVAERIEHLGNAARVLGLATLADELAGIAKAVDVITDELRSAKEEQAS